VARGRISRFPINLRRRPYNTLALPCECVIPATSAWRVRQSINDRICLRNYRAISQSIKAHL